MLSLPLPLISTFFPYTTLFRSPKEDEPIIKDVSFTIQEGEKVAILGRSGAGKSTLLKLLSGLIEPDRGEILIGNQIVNSSALARSIDRKSTRLNSSHVAISYAVFCLKKKKDRLQSQH